jgi:hypothetical protein
MVWTVGEYYVGDGCLCCRGLWEEDGPQVKVVFLDAFAAMKDMCRDDGCVGTERVNMANYIIVNFNF